MKELEKTLKALADPSRLRILNILLQQEGCVCNLQSVLELPQPLLSRHLAYLRNAGLVRDRRDGPRVWYSQALEGELGEAVQEFLQRLFPLFETFQTDSARMLQFTESCATPQQLQKSTGPQASLYPRTHSWKTWERSLPAGSRGHAGGVRPRESFEEVEP